MPLRARRGEQCLICALRALERLSLSRQTIAGGIRQSSSNHAPPKSPNQGSLTNTRASPNTPSQTVPYGRTKIPRPRIELSSPAPWTRSHVLRESGLPSTGVITSQRRMRSAVATKKRCARLAKEAGAVETTKEQRKTGTKHYVPRPNEVISTFGTLLKDQFYKMRKSMLRKYAENESTFGARSNSDLQIRLSNFEGHIDNCIEKAQAGDTSTETNQLFVRFRKAFVSSSLPGVMQELEYSFLKSGVVPVFSKEVEAKHRRLADLRYPTEWFPATRAMQRTIHLHVGPTNSGKTYHALKRLETAKTGIYAGPLRLLAHEVYTRFNAKGKLCALVTGEERRVPDGLKSVMYSCTVEMVPLNARVEVAVIDEIQMLGDSDRGWAWTQAFLGVQAEEVHLCGELRTIGLVEDLCKLTGDKLHIHKYERLSPLDMEGNSLNGNLNGLKKGDAMILFSRVAIHAMKSRIEKFTNKRCAVVYGSLPPETRAQQANLFNDPDNDYDFLVASDAVGMGLNLSIKRIIFEATSKHDGTSFRLIESSHIKQIAGRAGRYKSAHQAVSEGSGTSSLQPPTSTGGLITTLEKFDLPIVRKAMNANVPPLKSAGVFPPSSVILKFANYFPPSTPFSYILLRLDELATLDKRFHLCFSRDQIAIADTIQPLTLSPSDRVILIGAPVSLRDPGFKDVLFEFASCISNQTGGELLDMRTLNLELLSIQPKDHPTGEKHYLVCLEGLHKALTLYLWLSYRFAGVFKSQMLAFYVKGLVEGRIDWCLENVGWDKDRMKRINALRRAAIKKQEEAERLGGQLGEDGEGEAVEENREVNREGMRVIEEGDAQAVQAATTDVDAVEAGEEEGKEVDEDEDEKDAYGESTEPIAPKSQKPLEDGPVTIEDDGFISESEIKTEEITEATPIPEPESEVSRDNERASG